MRRWLLSLLVLVSVTGRAAYIKVTDVPNPRDWNANAYVCNPDGLITESEQAALDAACAEIEAQSGVQLAVVVLEDISYNDAFDFSVKLFNTWGIGHRDTNTGVLLLLVTGSRDIQIRTGSGIEPILTDAVCYDIWSDRMAESLSANDWAGALKIGVEEIGATVCSPAALGEMVLGYKPKQYSSLFIDILLFLCFLLLSFQIACVVARPWCPHCHRPMWMEQVDVHRESSFTEKGLATRRFRCHKCGEEVVQEEYEIWKKLTITQFILWMLWTFLKALLRGSGRGGSSGGSSGGSFGGGSTSGGGSGGKF